MRNWEEYAEKGKHLVLFFGKMRRLDVDRRRHRCTDVQVKEAR